MKRRSSLQKDKRLHTLKMERTKHSINNEKSGKKNEKNENKSEKKN